MPSSSSAAQPGRLVDRGGQHHHRAFVQDHLQVEAHLADHVQDDAFVWLLGGHENLAGGQRLDAAPPEFLNERRGRRLAQRASLLRLRSVHEWPVLRDHAIEDRNLREDLDQVLDPPTGDQDQLAAGGCEPVERLECFGCNGAVRGECAVIVRRQGEIAQPRCAWVQDPPRG